MPTSSRNSRSLLALALALFLPCGLSAQDVSRVTGESESAERLRKLATPEKKAASTRVIPSLYEGETEDLGPQLLLLRPPPHRWFFALADVQDYYTSNAALTEDSTTDTDVFVLTAQLSVEAPAIALGGSSGKLVLGGGYRYQNFLYGTLSFTQDDPIQGGVGTIDSLDFQTHTPYLTAEWSNASGWMAGAGLRYSAFIATRENAMTYQEWAPSAHAGRRFNLTERSFLVVDADLAYRITHTMLPGGLASILGADLNDRVDAGINVVYTHILGDRMMIQPAYRFQYSRYTEGGSTASAGAGRQDFLHTFSVTGGYYFNENIAARLFCSAEVRDSDEAPVSDYRNVNLGAGAMLSMRF